VPLISIILPFRNAAATLAVAVDSIRSQTLREWELLLWDDGSTDTSRPMAETLAEHDGRIRVLGGTHVGIVEALRQACAAATGDYLARMDADDIAHPDRLEAQLAYMESNPHVAVCGTQVRVYGPATRVGQRRYIRWLNETVSEPDILRELFIECPLPHPTFFLRRSAYEAIDGYLDLGWPEDYDLILRLFQAGFGIGKVPRVLLDWQDLPGRHSRTDPRYAERQFRAVKRHYLFRTYLKDRSNFYQWGPGEVGKRWLREWEERRPVAVVDINPKRIGETIHGVPVIAPEDLPPPGKTFFVVAVGAPDVRRLIREWCCARGYVEQRDYLFLA
jgi:glycosyltransferase involved in cell wall biosynthesis